MPKSLVGVKRRVTLAGEIFLGRIHYYNLFILIPFPLKIQNCLDMAYIPFGTCKNYLEEGEKKRHWQDSNLRGRTQWISSPSP